MTDDLMQSNEKWNVAWLTKDETAAENLAAEDYVYINPHGQVFSRTAILSIINSSSYQLSSGNWTEASINLLSSDIALVIDRFIGEGEYRGQSFEEDHRRTTVWVRREERWQVRLEHCSAITIEEDLTSE